MPRPNTPAASILYRESVRRATLADSLSDILNTVWQCERFEREHPTTCATIRSLAPRKVRQS